MPRNSHGLVEHVEFLEHRMNALQHRVRHLENQLCLLYARGMKIQGGAGHATPDEFNPFWDDISLNQNSFGAHVFPEIVVQNRMKCDIGATFQDQRNLFGSQSTTDWESAIQVSEPVDEPDSAAEPPSQELVHQVIVQQSREACIELQKRLKKAEKRNEVLKALYMLPIPLALDPLGCFVVERALGVDPKLAWKLQGSFAMLTISPHGEMVVQKALEGEESLRRTVLKEILQTNLEQALFSSSALPIWRRIWALPWDGEISAHLSAAIEAVFRKKWAKIAMQQSGGILIQDLIRAKLVGENSECIEELLENFLECVTHHHGVWVIQTLAEHGCESVRCRLAKHLLAHVADVCLSTYGAKVFQTIVRCTEPQIAIELADCLCRQSVHKHATFRPLLVDLALTQQGLPIVAQVRLFGSPSLSRRSARGADRSWIRCASLPRCSEATRAVSVSSFCVVRSLLTQNVRGHIRGMSTYRYHHCFSDSRTSLRRTLACVRAASMQCSSSSPLCKPWARAAKAFPAWRRKNTSASSDASPMPMCVLAETSDSSNAARSASR